MEITDRRVFVDRLRKDWARLVVRYRALSLEEQQAYLARQGYASLGALLAHIIAWWMDGQQVVENMREKPEVPLAHYDVDAFNARAVEKFGAMGEDTIVEMFEAQRASMLDLVSNLGDQEIQQPNINTRLYYEIIMHWKEHQINP